MRSTLALVTTLTIAAIAAVAATPAVAQTRVSSLDELRRALSPGDRITVVPAAGPPVEGRLIRFVADDIEIRLEKRAPHVRFDAAPVRTATAGRRAVYPRGRGIAVAVTLSR